MENSAGKNEEFKKKEEKINETISFLLEHEDDFKSLRAKSRFLALSFYEYLDSQNIEKLINENSCFLKELVFFEGSSDTDSLQKKDSQEKDDNSFKNELIQVYRKNGIIGFVKKYFCSDVEINSRDNRNDFRLISYAESNKSIHLNHKGGEEGQTIYGLKQSFSQLCDFLIQKETLPSYIFAESWLMDNQSLREYFGFKKILEFDFVRNVRNPLLDLSPRLWGQFFDKNGKFKDHELRFLFKNKKPRYKIVYAAVPVEYLFHKFGEKYKGREVLVEDSSIEIIRRKLELENLLNREKLARLYNSSNYQEFYNFFLKHPVWSLVIKEEIGKEFFKILKKEDSSKKSLEEIKKDPKYESIFLRVGLLYNSLENNYIRSLKKETRKIHLF